jgi:hypothetical protein
MSSAPLWGVQMFIRERAGIEAFEALVEQGRKDNVLARVAELERRCPFPRLDVRSFRPWRLETDASVCGPHSTWVWLTS